MTQAINNTDFSAISRFFTPNEKLLEFNKIMTKLLDTHCPIKTFKIKAKETFPWVNSVLISVKNQRDYLHSVWCESRSDADLSVYKTARQRWQKCNRDSIKTFYKSKGMSYFKNTKKFWQFYK